VTPTLYSIGHGSRGLSDFIKLLTEYGITCLVDVRSFPSSKRHPQFTRLAIEPALRGAEVRYVWEGAALGGLRRVRLDSPHTALTDPTLRGYADHMASQEFADGIGRMAAISRGNIVAFMCAERDPLHCHRSFIADFLLVQGARVLHIHDDGDVRQHALRPEARCVGHDRIVYDVGVQLGFNL
jgi:uncharacterized protein (DUF488 family)